MNNFDFTLQGILPLSQDVLGFLQSSYTESLSALGKCIAGPGATDMAIISGCAVSGGSTANGYIIVEGEILPFVGGSTAATIVIQEASLPGITYQDGTTRYPRHQRYATFGAGSGSIPWAPSNTIGGVSLVNTLLLQKTALDNATATILALNNTINNHINVGGHDWSRISGKPILLTGTQYLGDIPANDGFYQVSFIAPITGVYYIIGTLRSNALTDSSANFDNDIGFIVYNRTSNGFKVAVREYSSVLQDLWFDYMVVRA